MTVGLHRVVDIEYRIVDCIGYHIVDTDRIVGIVFHIRIHFVQDN